MNKPRILFVCAKNQWRSPTAEVVFRDDDRIDVRSAGLSRQSRHQISHRDVEWADLILVMEREHKSRLAQQFRDFDLPPITSLDIPDTYPFMDPELIEQLKLATGPLIKEMLA